MTNITLIGAGSVESTQILLADLSDFPELAGTHRTPRHRRAAAGDGRANRPVRERPDRGGLSDPCRVDRRVALHGADFVVNEIQVGGFDATLRDSNT